MRQQLAAYRPEDWASSDIPRITEHLATCSACHEAQAAFRQSGTAIRQLPTLVPPPAFREAVFAAIRSEAMRQAPSVAQMSRAATNPEMTVVRPVAQSKRPASFATTTLRQIQRPALRFSLVAAAAVLLLSLVGTWLITRTSAFAGTQANLGAAFQPKILKYPLGNVYRVPTSAMATSAWLAYAASDTSHHSMLFLENRSTRQTAQLLPSATDATVTVQGLTAKWVIWSVGDGSAVAPWQLYAAALTPLAGNGKAQPILLVDSFATGQDTPATLGGVWASGDVVLLADAARSGAGELLKIDLSTGAPVTTVVTHGQSANDLLTNPTYDNGTYYWADVWFDGTTGLHSAIWKADASGASQEISANETAFHPQVAHNTLVWVDVAEADLQQMASAAGSGGTTPDANLELIYSLSGRLDARDLATGQQWQVTGNAEVPAISMAGQLLLWQSGTQVHAYDLRQKAPLAADADLRSASFASADGSTVVWAETSSSDLFVYDAA